MLPAEFVRSRLNGTGVITEIPENFDPSRPPFQGHSKSSELHRSIGYLWLPIDDPQ